MGYLNNSGLELVWNKIKAYIDAKTGIAEDIGKVYEASKTVNIATAGADNTTPGASLTLPAGTYILIGDWCFNSTSSSARTIQVRLADSDNNGCGFQRLHMANGWYTELQTTAIVCPTKTTTYYVQGSCSAVPGSGGPTTLRAIRIK